MKARQMKISAAALVCMAGLAHGQVWNERGDAGDLPGSAQAVAGSGTLTSISGNNGASDTDMYLFEICDEANFTATTENQVTWDTQLWLFTAAGIGVTFCDDNVGGIAGPSTLTSTFVNSNGQYLLAISRYNRDAVTSTNALIWNNTPWEGERAPDGPGAASPIAAWVNTTTATAAYTIAMTGSCFITAGPSGACCFGAPNFNCTITSATSCATAGGTYQGDSSQCSSCPAAPTGACCLNTGCSVLTQAACLAAGGTYSGNNVSCGTANCPPPTIWVESGEAGELPNDANVVAGSGSLNTIQGALGVGDADMYQISVCDAANFSASTVGGTTVDTMLAIFRSDGTGVAFNDDHIVVAPEGTTLQSRITNQFVGPAGNGDYYLAISQWNKLPFGNNGNIWINDGIAFPYRSERAPDGPGASDAVTGWVVTTGAGGNYSIALTGACFVGGCYANCDGSTGTPALTANDFQCFINAYAANLPYANCDGSTGTPALTANDFQCFINEYAGGCQ